MVSPIANLLSLLFLFLFVCSIIQREKIFNFVERHINNPINSLEIQSILSPRNSLFLASAISLFAELLIIRVHSSFFQVFGFYKNVSLLSCFLGIGIGLAKPNIRIGWLFLCPLIFCLQITYLYLLRFTILGVFLLNPSMEYGAMGVDTARNFGDIFIVNFFLLCVYASNALCFIPLGYLISYFSKNTTSSNAYAINIGGSIFGILLFTFLTFVHSNPLIWVSVFLGSLLLLNLHRTWIYLIFFSAFISSILSYNFSLDRYDIYSPYQLLTVILTQRAHPTISVNNFYYQKIFDFNDTSGHSSKSLLHYSLPYYFKPSPDNVLVLAGGTGNDTASALKNGASHVDVVEIDPIIIQLGMNLHPSQPYQSNKVDLYQDDARNYIKKTDQKYDLIVYGLLDSHSSISGNSSIRLDSYVYTIQSFKQSKSLLTEDGIMCLSFATGINGGHLTYKLYLMLLEAFNGKKPFIYRTYYDESVTFCISPKKDLNTEHPNGLTDGSSEIESYKSSNLANTNSSPDLATDDWPFLFMNAKSFPMSYFLTFFILAVFSFYLIKTNIPGFNKKTFKPLSFFLGIGFMLLETKAITELALVYGSVWQVIAITIIAVLIMAYIANLITSKMNNINDNLIYLLIFSSIILSFIFNYYLAYAIPNNLLIFLSPVFLVGPLFFSGIAFSKEIKKGSFQDVLSSNIMGAIFGCILEYNSLQFGLSSLYFISFGVYLACFFITLRINSKAS